MRTWNRAIAAGLIVTCLLWARPAAAQVASAQQPQPTTAELKKDIEALQAALKAIQKDLQDIKALLQSRPAAPAPAPAPQNVVLDLGNHPSRGEQSARLVLVEFSDYQ